MKLGFFIKKSLTLLTLFIALFICTFIIFLLLDGICFIVRNGICENEDVFHKILVYMLCSMEQSVPITLIVTLLMVAFIVWRKEKRGGLFFILLFVISIGFFYVTILVSELYENVYYAHTCSNLKTCTEIKPKILYNAEKNISFYAEEKQGLHIPRFFLFQQNAYPHFSIWNNAIIDKKDGAIVIPQLGESITLLETTMHPGLMQNQENMRIEEGIMSTKIIDALWKDAFSLGTRCVEYYREDFLLFLLFAAGIVWCGLLCTGFLDMTPLPLLNFFGVCLHLRLFLRLYTFSNSNVFETYAGEIFQKSVVPYLTIVVLLLYCLAIFVIFLVVSSLRKEH